VNRRTGVAGYVLAGVALAALSAVAWVVSPRRRSRAADVARRRPGPVRRRADRADGDQAAPRVADDATRRRRRFRVRVGRGSDRRRRDGRDRASTVLARSRRARSGPRWLADRRPALRRGRAAGRRHRRRSGRHRDPSAAGPLGRRLARRRRGSGIRLRSLLFGTALGELPWAIVGVAIGVSVDRLANGGTASIDPTVLVAMAGLGTLLLAGPLYRTFIRDRASPTA